MKKLFLLLGVLFLVGCNNGNGDMEISVSNEPVYQQGERTEITLQVNEGNNTVNGVALDGTLEMERMDHGIIEVHFEENGDGTYTGLADLPMAGDWILNLTAKKDDKTYQTVLTINIK